MSDPLYRDPSLDPTRRDELDIPYADDRSTSRAIWLLGILIAIAVIAGVIYAATDPNRTASTSKPAAVENTGSSPVRAVPPQAPAIPAPAPSRP